MFDGVLDVKIGYVLCGIIWSLAVGFAIGNYACSLVHRLPRGRLILDKPPYCGHCGTLLATKDLFPVFSALWLKHRCRYCKTPFPVSHTWTELLVGLLLVLAYFKFNYGEQFLLVSILGVFLIILAAIHANESMLMGKMLFAVGLSGIMFRILLDHSIFNFVEGGLYALIIAVVIWRKQVVKVGHIYTIPPQAQLLVVGGLCVGASQLPQFLTLYVVLWCLSFVIGKIKIAEIPYSVPFGFAVMISVMYRPAIPLLPI
jgi:prepilin signal peptidase PulO-like enzyme (type II secretory pathway)